VAIEKSRFPIADLDQARVTTTVSIPVICATDNGTAVVYGKMRFGAPVFSFRRNFRSLRTKFVVNPAAPGFGPNTDHESILEGIR
jgi:hypothetical protein